MSAAMGAASLHRWPMANASTPAAGVLTVTRRTLDVAGKSASVFGLVGPNGLPGLTLDPDEKFSITLDNQSNENTIIHWHGQVPPPDQDGVSNTGYETLIASGEKRHYDFTPRVGTHWMHSHHRLQKQLLLDAPLIIRSRADLSADRQEMSVMFNDFSFRAPDEILAGLNGKNGMAHADTGMNHGGTHMMNASMDLNDVDYDAYLANDRTLDDPVVLRTERNGRVLLRLINAAASTSFWIHLNGTQGHVQAVDGNPIHTLRGNSFPLAQGQRLDLLVDIPAGKVVTLLAQREGDRVRTGVILAGPNVSVNRISPLADVPAGPIDLSQEVYLKAAVPLPDRPVEIRRTINLAGSMSPYVWSMDGRVWADRTPIEVKKNQRVELEIVNTSPMAHPMHLHGHHFQVVAINGSRMAGAMRDTILVPANGGSVTIAFDTDNPGRWLFHCHNLYHMATGMMTELVYKQDDNPAFM